jgi:hypothetical protein
MGNALAPPTKPSVMVVVSIYKITLNIAVLAEDFAKRDKAVRAVNAAVLRVRRIAGRLV